jgi:hypothetical protein
MPIGIDLLRPNSEGGSIECFYESQCRRYPEVATGNLRAQLEGLQRRDIERRAQAKDLEHRRNELKIMQRSLAPASEQLLVYKEDVKRQIKSRKALIQADHDQLQAEDRSIRDELLRVGNLVDSELYCHTGIWDVPLPESDLIVTNLVVDPWFCLGGYERVHLEGSSPFTAVTGVAVDLARSIATLAISCLKTELFPVVSLPDHLSLPPETVRSLLGYETRAPVLQNHTTTFLAASMLFQEKIVWDRELPRGCLCLSNNHGGTTYASKQKWFQKVTSEQVVLLGLAGGTLEESRMLQLDVVGRIVSFYSSLLVANHPGFVLQRSRQQSPMVRNRVLAPHQLELSEASRIVVEGFLHGEYVTLASVSNRTDFCTRALNIRCGGTHVAHVHSIDATCCTVYETLEWVMQNNVLCKEDTGDLGVGISSNLATLLEFSSKVFLPFKRRLEVGRAGRKPVVKELKVNSPCLIGEGRVKVEEEIKAKAPFALERLPNRQEVLAERFMSPYDFLPLW